MYLIICIGLFILSVLFVLAVSMPRAEASGDHDHCGHGKHSECVPPPDPEPTPDPGPVVHKKDTFTGKDFLLSAVHGCGSVSLYQGIWNKRWRWPYQWCLDPLRPPRKTTAADDRVTPDNIQNRYIIEAR